MSTRLPLSRKRKCQHDFHFLESNEVTCLRQHRCLVSRPILSSVGEQCEQL